MNLPDLNPEGYVTASISNVTAFHKVEHFRSTLPDDLRAELDEKLEEVEASELRGSVGRA